MLGLQLIEDETDPTTGLEWSVVTDPAHATDWLTKVTTNFAAETLGKDQTDYYAKWDTDKEHPMNRAGHRWSVRLRDPKPE